MSESKRWKSVTGYQLEGSNYPYLAWVYDVSSPALKEERVRNVVNLLRDSPMNMSAAELLEYVLSSGTDFAPARSRFFKNKIQVKGLLNLIYQDKEGRSNFEEWMEEKDIPLRMVTSKIDEEMESVKSLISTNTSDVDVSKVREFDFQRHVSDVVKYETPTLSRVLGTAARSPQANKYKASNFVSSYNISLHLL